MAFQTKQINNEVVKAVPLLVEKDTRPVKGFKLFPEMNANIFLCAKKKSGKTSTIYKILQKCCGPDTKIIVFCATLHKDKSWLAIQAWAERKGIVFVGHTSLKDDNGVDKLEELVMICKPKLMRLRRAPPNMLDSSSEEEDDKPRRPKYQTPEYIFILDDLSTELKSTTVGRLLKVNRHFLSKTLLSSQWLNDLAPGSRKQMDYFILFRGHMDKKLEEIYRDANLAIPLEQFIAVYKFATEEPFSFLYVDTNTGEFRRNFNTLIEVELSSCSDSHVLTFTGIIIFCVGLIYANGSS